ncbi:MAG: RNA methyltransferase [Candidatus Nezhaarchaeota archaeon]|nr:RNA methyltransferase [Candidatus Nezhaarchaeota archaeon]
MRITVALPSTLTAESASLAEKTMKVGFIARVLSVFRVEELVLYVDKTSNLDERPLLSKLFNYIACPQYLRKRVFRLDPDLKYAGLMPPLNTPNHPLERGIRDLPEISYREGLVLGRRRGNRYIVDVGLERCVSLNLDASLRRGDRVVLRLSKDGAALKAELVDRSDVPHYFGFKVEAKDVGLRKLIELFKGVAAIIATSRYGKRVHDEALKVADIITKREGNVVLLFGSPFTGLYDIAKAEGFNLEECVDFTLNFLPGQGTKTVRVEEALCATLAILRFLYEAHGPKAPKNS